MANHRAPVPEWLNKSYMEEILQNLFQDPNIEVEEIRVTPGSKEGDNYAFQVLRIQLEYKNDDNRKELSVIGKLKPDTETVKAADNVLDFFLNEATFFSKLFPVLKEISPKTAKNIAPECLYVDYKHKALILEDLVLKHFAMPKRGQMLNKETALLTMEILAALHGASYRAVEKDPTLKETFQKTMWGSAKNELIEIWYGNAIRGLNKNVDEYGFPEKWCEKLKDIGRRLKKESFKVCDLKEDDLNVVCHGDIWMNNLMYHFTDAVIDQVIMLDFQFVTYNNFAQDLHYFLFSSVQADVLVNDLDSVLEFYYTKLKEFAPEIPNLTLERVRKEFFNRRFFGCAIGVLCRASIYVMTPFDVDSIVAGVLDEMGFQNPDYVEDLRKMVPFMEKTGFFSEDF